MFSVRYRVVSCFSVLMGFIAFLFGKRDDFIDLTFSLLNAFNVSFFFIYIYVCFFSGGGNADRKFKIGVLCSLFLYLIFYVFVNIFLYKKMSNYNPYLDSISFNTPLIFSVSIFLLIIIFQIRATLRGGFSGFD